MSPGEDRTAVDVHRAAHPLGGPRQPVAFDEELNSCVLAHSHLSFALWAWPATIIPLTSHHLAY